MGNQRAPWATAMDWTPLAVAVPFAAAAAIFLPKTRYSPSLLGLPGIIPADNMLGVMCIVMLAVSAGMTSVVRDRRGRMLDPQGGPRWKNWVAFCLVKLGELKRKRLPHDEAEKFPHGFAEQDPHWNESKYFAGIADNGDTVATRMSRHGPGGAVAYVYLHIQSKQHGLLTLELDNVPCPVLEPGGSDSMEVGGVKYECIEPMGKWRLSFKGSMETGYPRDKLAADPTLQGHAFPLLGKRASQHVDLVLEFTAETPPFRYHQDDSRWSLAKILAQESWSLTFFRDLIGQGKRRGSNREHYEQWGRVVGRIEVGQAPAIALKMRTFRDHSWDIREWLALQRLLALFVAMDPGEEIVVAGRSYEYLEVTLVQMPANPCVQFYVIGWLGAPVGASYSNLPLSHATPLDEIPGADTSAPIPQDVNLVVEAGGDLFDVSCKNFRGELPFLYWPGDGDFKLYDGAVKVKVNSLGGKGVIQYGYVRDYEKRRAGMKVNLTSGLG